MTTSGNTLFDQAYKKYYEKEKKYKNDWSNKICDNIIKLQDHKQVSLHMLSM